MKKIIWLLLFCAVASQMLAQTCPGPSQRTALINLQRAGVTESTRAGQFPLTDTCGNLRYAQYTEVNLTPIAYTPTSTGNTANLSEFVITPAADVWYIDWQGNAILVYSATMATGDKDFLENDSNLPPNNIQDTMYTKSMTTFGGRVYMPGQDVLIIDSVANADFIVNGFRNAQVSVYDNLSQAYAQLSQIGNESKIVLGENSALFKLQSATGTNPVVPAAPFKTLLQYLEADTSWYLPTYPPLRDDAITPSNFLGTDIGGRVVSLPITSIPGAVQAYVYNDAPGTDPGITPDPVAGPFLAYNEGAQEEWFYDMPSGFWVLTSDPGGYFITSSEFTGTAEPGDPLTLAQQGATVGQALVWDGTAWEPGTVSIAEPANQIVYGTDTGVDSSPTLEKNGDTLAINPGNLLIRPTNNFSNYYTLNIWPKKNNGPTANMGILRIPMDSISNRANTDPYHGNFPAWLKKMSWDNSINVPAGGPLDTTGNLLVNEGFNFDQSDPTYNPKFPQFYWSTEMKYRSGTNTKSWIESHWEFRDTLGRIARPVSTAYSYDGSYADVSFQTDYKTFGKGRDQAALTPGVSNWELANFTTGQYDINYNLSQNIKKKYTGNLIQKYKNKTPGDAYMNIIKHESNDIVQIGDSAGVRIYNDLYFALNGSNPAKIKAQQTVLRFDSMLVEFVSQPGVLRNHRYLAPGIAASAGLLFDGNKLSWGKYAVAESIFGVNINAPNDALHITSAGKLVYNAPSTAAFADFDLNQRTDAFGGGLRLLNTGGTYTTLRANSNGHLTITGNSVALSDKVIATTNDITAIEGIVTAPQGSIAMSGGGGGATANGALFGKYSGTGPTGWGKYLNLIDPNTATSGQVLTWSGSTWAPATPTAITNIYNSNGTTGAARTVTLTDYIRWNLTTNAGTGIAPMSIRVGGTAPNLQSWVATSSNDSLVTKFDNSKGFITQSNNNIILQNTDANNGITIDETSASVITTGGVVRNASSRLDATSNVTIAPSNSVVVAQPGCTDLALTQIGTTSGLERQGTSHWVTNFSGGTLTITPFAGESINNSSSATIPDGKSAWIMCIGPGDFALMVGQ